MSASVTVGIGQTFGSWTVLTVGPSKRKKRTYLCRCVCGVERLVLGRVLRNGESASCGCRKGARIAVTRARLKQQRVAAIALLKRAWLVMDRGQHHTTAADIEAFMDEVGEPLPLPKSEETVQ